MVSRCFQLLSWFSLASLLKPGFASLKFLKLRFTRFYCPQGGFGDYDPPVEIKRKLRFIRFYCPQGGFWDYDPPGESRRAHHRFEGWNSILKAKTAWDGWLERSFEGWEMDLKAGWNLKLNTGT